MTKRYLTSFCFLLAGASAHAIGGTTATFDLTGTNNGANMGGVYTSPYYAKITTGGTTVSTAAICDDFADDSYLGETWTADVTSLSSLTSQNATVKWQGTTWDGTSTPTVLTQAQEYMAAAILTEELLPVAATNPTLAGEYGYGIWALTYTGPSSESPEAYLNNNAVWQTVEGYVNSAVSEAKSDSVSAFSNVTIYSYASGATGCPPSGTCSSPPQEFIVVGMPEPSMTASLLFYLSVLACFAIVFRGRIAQSLR